MYVKISKREREREKEHHNLDEYLSDNGSW